MEKRIFAFCMMFLSLAGLLNAQGVQKKWAIVQDLNDKIVYIDTTTIREFDQKITLWSLVVYREPKEITPIQQKISQIKSQFLINPPLKKYSVLGTFYYDLKGKMVGETSAPTYSLNNDSYSINIVENSTIDVLYKKAKAYLANGKFDDEKSEFLKNFDKNVSAKADQLQLNKEVKKDSVTNQKPRDIDSAVTSKLKQITNIIPLKSDTIIVDEKKDKLKINEQKKDTLTADVAGVNKLLNTAPKIDSAKVKADIEKNTKVDNKTLEQLKKQIADDNKNSQIQLLPVNVPDTSKQKKTEVPAVKLSGLKHDEKKEDKIPAVDTLKKEVSVPNIKPNKQIEISSGDYDASKETNPQGMIFTDGKLFCFQLSSWKIKAQADKEIERLMSLGYKAFIQEAAIPKKGKWYRVRIGYFNTLQDAADYKKKMK